MKQVLSAALIFLISSSAQSADLVLPKGGLGPFTASVSAYRAHKPGETQCSKMEGDNVSATPGKRPRDYTYDKNQGEVMVAIPGYQRFKNCSLFIPGLGSGFVVWDHMPGDASFGGSEGPLSNIDISHSTCASMEKFGRRLVRGVYVLKTDRPGCNLDRVSKKRVPRSRRPAKLRRHGR